MTEQRYWQALFNYRTWQAFLADGGRSMGFREGRWPTVQHIQPGDYLLCYLTGVSRWVGAVVADGEGFQETKGARSEEPFPVRLPVKPVVSLTPETGIPVGELSERLSVFQGHTANGHWTARFRASPTRWSTRDGELVMEALLEGEVQPVIREVDHRRLWRRPPGLSGFRPGASDTLSPVNISGLHETTSHNEIQWLLLKLGADMGLNLWVARNDRGRRWAGQRFDALPGLLHELPQPFEPATRRIIEMIDVLWLKGNTIVAAFEVESTTVIYSGLLRMADLVALQPNLRIPLYLVAPDERRSKVMAEIQRPSFSRLAPPLSTICRFVPFAALRARAQQVATVLPYLQPDFIREIAEPCDTPPSRSDPGPADT